MPSEIENNAPVDALFLTDHRQETYIRYIGKTSHRLAFSNEPHYSTDYVIISAMDSNKAQKKKGFDVRIVRYEQIHKVKPEYYSALVKAIDPKPNEKIFEGCAGYADVSKHIFDLTKDWPEKPDLYILDESEVQIARARTEINLPADHIILGDIRRTAFSDNTFDKVVIKMGVHELPKDEQPKIFSGMFRILKPGGKFVMWELSLNERTQKLFQDVLRKKDELSGFDLLVKNRYFQRYDELHGLFDNAGFKNVTDEYKIRYPFNPKGRFEELISKDRIQMLDEDGSLSEEDEKELKRRAQERVDALIQYIRDNITDSLKGELEYKDLGSDLEMTFDKIIMSGIKP